MILKAFHSLFSMIFIIINLLSGSGFGCLQHAVIHGGIHTDQGEHSDQMLHHNILSPFVIIFQIPGESVSGGVLTDQSKNSNQMLQKIHIG